ncbi:MAG TPA: AsmA family protein [Silvibacterium sp.]|nr:AsmA family protein [Silvibacterium sp.]
MASNPSSRPHLHPRPGPRPVPAPASSASYDPWYHPRTIRNWRNAPPRTQRIWIIVAAIIVVLLIAIFIVDHFLDADTYRPRVEAALSQSLGRPVQLGHLSFSIFSGSLVAKTPSIEDDPAFSNQPFLTAKDIRIGVDTGAFLFHRQLHITGLTIDQPQIALIRNQNGVWNYSTLGGSQQKAATAPTTDSANAVPDLTVKRLNVKHGTMTVSDLPARGQPHVYSDLDITARNFSFASAFPFSVSSKLPSGGSLNITGNAGPVNAHDASLSPFNAHIALNHADLLASGFVQPSQGLAGIADLDATIVSNGQTANANGKLHLTQLKLAANGTPSSQPVDMQFSIDQDLQSLSGKISSANLQIGKAALAVNGAYQTQANTTSTQLTANGNEMPINDLVAFLPSLGIQLPAGSRLQGGTLTANLNISGPSTASVISGPVHISNTQLAGFDLGQKLSSIQSLTGAKTGHDTTIQTLSANLHYGPDGTRTDNLVAVVTGLGSASGSGSISPAGALNYHLNVKLNAGVGSVATKAVGLLPGVLGSAASQSTSNGIPLSITGTTSSPIFTPDMGKMLGGVVPGAKSGAKSKPLGKSLGGILGH